MRIEVVLSPLMGIRRFTLYLTPFWALPFRPPTSPTNAGGIIAHSLRNTPFVKSSIGHVKRLRRGHGIIVLRPPAHGDFRNLPVGWIKLADLRRSSTASSAWPNSRSASARSLYVCLVGTGADHGAKIIDGFRELTRPCIQ